MFTGIVEAKGEILAVENLERAVRLRIHAPGLLDDAEYGCSIAVEGVCLTVTSIESGEVFTADVMEETLKRSTLRHKSVGDRLNLERAMAANARFGGHVVQGHVDGTAELLQRHSEEHWDVLRFSLPPNLKRYVVEKGSITVCGTSLTVSALSAESTLDEDGWFEVSLIPTTLNETTLGVLEVGQKVNLEVDVLAKYVERMLRFDPQSSDSAAAG
ncbi:riboflavin synthase [Corynebacterium gerontici]|uniref:Riboflavin synthase n=1 Tax=Corynebacterium gerontici TaxID=2079234 RepID=A0A3G6J0C8_9CORY|nr:riboflavin synthase [Corynebacterium gerontici]AZA11495.1 Riboflavin synthase [Corynebacterium gerontici]